MKKFSTPDTLFPRLRVLIVAMLLVLAAGCSTIRFSYNHGDTLLYWWLNAYLDLDSDQSDWVKKDIDQLLQWHRKTQLRDYAGLLTNWQRQLAGNPTQADLLADYRDVKTRTELLALKALPEMADLARSVKPDQIAQMEKKFRSNNDDFRKKFMSGDVEKQRKARFKKAMDQLELWFGRFSSDQEATLRRASDARPLDNEIWLQERVLRQQKIIGLLRRVQGEKLNKEQTMAAIHNLLREFFDRMEAPERKAFFESYVDSTSKFILAAIRIATPAQKAHAQQRMQGWIDDFNTLAKEAK
jgi:hypothetical protein